MTSTSELREAVAEVDTDIASIRDDVAAICRLLAPLGISVPQPRPERPQLRLVKGGDDG
jgi:hypothetical protein